MFSHALLSEIISYITSPKLQISLEKLVTSSTAVSLLTYLAVNAIVALVVFSLFSNALAIPRSVNLALFEKSRRTF